jgi:hypothetical protein
LKKTHHKKSAGGVAQGVAPEFKPQYRKKKKKKKKKKKREGKEESSLHPHIPKTACTTDRFWF